MSLGRLGNGVPNQGKQVQCNSFVFVAGCTDGSECRVQLWSCFFGLIMSVQQLSCLLDDKCLKAVEVH